MNPMEKHKKKNKTSENTTYLIDNKIFLCQHKHLHPLTSRRGNGYQNQCIEKLKESFSMIHRNVSLQKGREYLSNQKWTNCEIDYELFCFFGLH